jgi:hypothetical protein
MISYKNILIILSVIILAASMIQAKSVYVINDTGSSEMYAYHIKLKTLI